MIDQNFNYQYLQKKKKKNPITNQSCLVGLNYVDIFYMKNVNRFYLKSFINSRNSPCG
jgi:hypothetical protein